MSATGYRRGSIFWALTLIAVGSLFLYHNFNPALRPWHIIAKYWPVIIIFWGLSKLFDYIQASQHPESAPQRFFTGGEVLLLVLILALGTAISRMVLRPMHEWPRAFGVDIDADFLLNSYSFPETLSVPAKQDIRLMVTDQQGDVEVRAGDKPSVEAVVKREIKAENQEAAKKINDTLKVEIVEEAGTLVVRSNRDSLPGGGRGVTIDLVLSVPKGTSADVTSARGDITVEGMKGNQTVASRSGDVRVSNVEGLVKIHKAGGSVSIRGVKGNVEVDGRGDEIEAADVSGTVTVSGEFSGSVDFAGVDQVLRFNSSRTNMTAQKLPGQLSMERGSLDARGVEGPFEISTRHKDVTLAEFRNSVKISTTNGDVRLETSTPPAGQVEVDVRKGKIALAIPEKSNFRIDATSRHGEVESAFAAATLKVNQEGESPSITGSYGKGGPSIRLTTSYGSISLEHWGSPRAKDGKLTPPTPPTPPSPGSPAPAPSPPAKPGPTAEKNVRIMQPLECEHVREKLAILERLVNSL